MGKHDIEQLRRTPSEGDWTTLRECLIAFSVFLLLKLCGCV